MIKLPRVFRFDKHKISDFKEFLKDHRIEIHLIRDQRFQMICGCCNQIMESGHGSYKVKIQHMPIFTHHCFLVFRRQKGYCYNCKKVRSEKLDFLSKDTPHKSNEYAWWIGRLCEISPVANVAKLLKEDSSTTWRLDYKRMKRMLSQYCIPKVKRICVDEVYARRKLRPGENRSDLFLTIICDLETRRVVWVSYSRRKEALDEFFLIIGKKACEEIRVVATDMHDDYGASVKEYCKKATLVWDRFHVMQAFDQVLNEERKTLHEDAERGSEEKYLSRGKFRFNFTKKANRRSQTEQQHIDDLVIENEDFLALELIKEGMHQFFNCRSEKEAEEMFDVLGGMIMAKGFQRLLRWHNYMETRWGTLKNYFSQRYSTVYPFQAIGLG